MPELPEIQALAERLDASLAGRRVAGIELLHFSCLKTVVPSPEELVGRSLVAVGRRGKYLVWEMGGPRMLVHLSQGGRLDLEDPPKRSKPRGAAVRLRFADAPSVLVKEFGKERKVGLWLIAEGDEGPLARLGPEPDSQDFHDLLMEGMDKRRVHSILRDQRTVAGMGRGYSDDALHAAGLSPFASLSSLDPRERADLLDAIRQILTDALDVERRREGGLPTKLGDHFTVHNRAGEPCPRCCSDLRRVSYESYEITYCPDCQTNGKILADRRMSRLLR